MATPAWPSEYLIQQGDTIEISVAGLPDLRKKSVIGLNGQFTLPLIGEVQAEGLTLPELRAIVRDSFERQAYRSRSASSSAEIILSGEVTLDIAEYRPVYVTGGVLAPGSQPFRPGLTVRQAVTLAGGLGRPGMNDISTHLKVASLVGQRASLTLDVDRQTALLKRLEAELSEVDGLAFTASSPATTSAPAQLEKKLMEERAAQFALESEGLRRRIQQTSTRLAQIEQQFNVEQRAQQADEIELQKLEGLIAKGLVTASRVLETRRFVLMSATRALQTSVQAEVARRELDDFKDKLNILPTQRRIHLLSEIQDTRSRLGAATVTLEAVSEQLKTATNVGSGGHLAVVASVTRKVRSESVTLIAGEDDALAPGDVVTIGVAARAALTN